MIPHLRFGYRRRASGPTTVAGVSADVEAKLLLGAEREKRRTMGRWTRRGLSLLLLGGMAWLCEWGTREAPATVVTSAKVKGQDRSRLTAVTSAPRVGGGGVPADPVEDALAARAQAELAVKIAAFAGDRRALVQRITRELGMEPPPGTDEFFAAVAALRWEEVDARFVSLLGLAQEADASDALCSALAPVFEAYCVVDAVQSRSAEQFFASGQGLMESAGPANAYLCNDITDYGILTLLNATGETGRKIVLAPVLLADPSYTAYLRVLYPGQMANLSSQDISRAYQACTMAAGASRAAAGEVTNVSEQIPQELARTLVNMNPQLTFARMRDF